METKRIFDKSKYAAEPSTIVGQVIEKLAVLGDAVVAVRGPGFSANLIGKVYIGEDGGDPVLRVEDCKNPKCHIHVKWNWIEGYCLAQEDVGYGPEPVIYLIDKDGDPIVNIFYPGKTFTEIESLLA